MKIAHFVQYAPTLSGLYETTREIALGQREFLGWDARLIDVTDVSVTGGKSVEGIEDRGVEVTSRSFAQDADIHFLHSGIPAGIEGSKPTFFVAHGLPEYCFYSQVMMERDSSNTTRTTKAKTGPTIGSWGLVARRLPRQPWMKAAITMWRRHVPFWEIYFPKVILANHFCDMKRFHPDGPAYDFSVKPQGNGINIVFADHWRYTAMKDPFQLIHGAAKFCERTGSVIHLIAVPKEVLDGVGPTPVVQIVDHPWHDIIMGVKKGMTRDVIGEIRTIYDDMPRIHRAADVVVSPACEDNRTVLEASACGCPVIARLGAHAAMFHCRLEDPYDVDSVLTRVHQQILHDRSNLRRKARAKAERFKLEDAVKAIAKGIEDCNG